MRNKDRIVRQNIIILILNIVIVGMCLLTLIVGGVAASNLYSRFSIPYDERTLYYCVERGDFGRLVTECEENIQAGFEKQRNMQEYYGVAKYFEAASYYKAYLETGDTVRAERELAKMEEALPEMGGWSILEGEIKSQLDY